jgi:hypothetical protein
MIDREKVVRAVETCFDSWIDKHQNMGLNLHEVEQMKRDALELLKEQGAVEPREQEETRTWKVNIEFTKEEFNKIIAYMDQIQAETVQDAIEHAIDLLLAVD